jgi:bifunctional NMN adenylyltransferase/nudix hydrolase
MLQNKTEKSDATTGVIVGRFQVHKLHEVHRELIEHVVGSHPKVIVALGITSKLGTANNPLDFMSRQRMILEDFPNVVVIAIHDNRSDENWSKDLDRRIREVSPTGSVLLYGARDSFIKHYSGANKTQELECTDYNEISGTEIRKLVSRTVIPSADFRAGVIYGCTNQYPKGFPTVDAAVVDDGKLLLGRKANEDKFRFIGGFFDPSVDRSLETAAKREVSEETGGMTVEVDRYLGSIVINDWRYRGEKDKIITAFFQMKRLYGPAHASDDIAELKWFDLNKIKHHEIMEEHIPLMDMFLAANGLKYWSVENNDISSVKMSLDGMNL